MPPPRSVGDRVSGDALAVTSLVASLDALLMVAADVNIVSKFVGGLASSTRRCWSTAYVTAIPDGL